MSLPEKYQGMVREKTASARASVERAVGSPGANAATFLGGAAVGGIVDELSKYYFKSEVSTPLGIVTGFVGYNTKSAKLMYAGAGMLSGAARGVGSSMGGKFVETMKAKEDKAKEDKAK